MNKFFRMLVLVTLFGFISCSGSRKILIDTYSMQISGGKLTAWEILDGVKGKLLDSQNVNASNIELNLGGGSNPALVELENAIFIDFSSENFLTFSPVDKWSIILNDKIISESQNTPFQINPVTSFEATLALFKSFHAVDKEEMINKSRTIIKDHFRLNADVTAILNNPGKADTKNALDAEGLRYYLILGGLEKLAGEITNSNMDILGSTVINLNDITRTLIEDIGFDGIVDGMSAKGQLSIGNYLFSEQTLRDDLVNGIRAFMKDKGIEENPEIFSMLQNILTGPSELFGFGGTDFQAPIIRLVYPAEWTFIGGTVKIKLEFFDNSGVDSASIYTNGPGKIEIIDLNPDPLVFEGEIDTKLFQDGLFPVIVEPKDMNGNISKSIFNWYLDNTGPLLVTNLNNGTVFRDQVKIVVEISEQNGSGIGALKIKLGENYLNNIQNDAPGRYIAEIDSNTLPDGYITVEVESSDKVGNSTIETDKILVNNTILSVDRYINTDRITEPFVVEVNHEPKTMYAGDLNADGYPDFVNTHHYVVYSTLQGFQNSEYAYIHYGNSGFDYRPFSPLPVASANYISDVAANCDFNGDGIGDLAIGHAMQTCSQDQCYGDIHVLFGPFSEQSYSFSITLTPNWLDYIFGITAFGARLECSDVDNDGRDDLISYASNSLGSRIYLGPDFEHTTAFSNADGSTHRIGDINGDGIEDLAVGYNSVLLGSSDRHLSAFITIPDHYADAVAQMGDADHDGYRDIIVGNPVTAKAIIIYGGPNFPNRTLTLPSLPNATGFGRSVAAGDIDGDGYSDAIVSAPNANFNGLNEAGEVYVFFGPVFNKYKTIRSAHPESYDYFGHKIQSGFDANLDGRLDLLVREIGLNIVRIGSFHIFYDGK